MKLVLCELPPLKGPDEWGNKCPRWASFLAPDAARSLLVLEADTGGIDYTDIFRPPSVSLDAIKANKRGVQPPGKSAHNYGLAVDLTVDEILKTKGWSYEKLVETMEAHGWYCHRRDKKRGMEDWHFNYFGANASKYIPLAVTSWEAPAEAQMQALYGAQMKLSPVEIQRELSEMKLYKGEIDGNIGPLTKSAIRVFQQAWGLTPDGDPGPNTQRTLALVGSDRSIVPIPT